MILHAKLIPICSLYDRSSYVMKLFWEGHDISIGLNYHISKIRMHGLICPPKLYSFV